MTYLPVIELPRPVLIGMVQLPPLPGSPRNDQSVRSIIDRALRDAEALESAGFDALIVENFGDAPFVAARLAPASVAALAIVAARVKEATAMMVGVNALRNDARSAMGVAAATGADFIRVNVHVGVAATDQGWIEGRAADTLRYRRQLNVDVGVFADVHVKHAVPISQPDIDLAARETAYRGLADVLIVSGPATGQPADIARVRQVKQTVPDRPVLVGSGVTAGSVQTILAACDGVIVGTSIKQGCQADSPVDPGRAEAFIRAARG